MTIEITKGSENPVADFFSSPSNTPETDAENAQFAMGGFTLDFCRKLERERDEAAAAVEREQEACAGWQQEVCDRDANALRLQGVIR